MKNSKSIKFKIAVVYIVLFAAALFSGGYIFKEVKRITLPEQSVIEESNKVFLVSSAITSLYSSEASSRSAILTGKEKDIKSYNSQIDSIYSQIENIKLDVIDPYIAQKLDTVQLLLDKKKQSFSEIISFRKSINQNENYDSALKEIYSAKEEIEKKHKPIVQVTESQRKSLLSRLGQALRAEAPDTVKTTINYPKLTDSLVNAMERIFAEAQKKDSKFQRELLQKEQSLLLENKILTDQLRTILHSVEQNIINTSYQKINESKAIIGNATDNIAWIGGSAIITVIILGWIILQDLNQTQQYRIKLEKLNREKEDLLRSKTMLLATVTHDIQTPLGSVLGFTELLSKTQLSDKQNKYIKNIQSSSEYIVKLVNDLVDFSKLENNKISISEEVFNFKTLINDTCFPLVPIADNKKITFKWTIDESLNDKFTSDPERIKQVLTNLITNAIKFTQEGGVELIAKSNERQIIIQVIDSGIGIEKSQIEHVFQEFRQAHDGIEKKFGGTGLGLNISKRIITLLNGTISASSELNKGSIFTITLPKKTAPQVDTISSVKNNDKSIVEEKLKEKRVLIIDDDKLQLQLMEEIFTPLFKEVILINDATNAISILTASNFDLVLTDIQMPKMDGFELIQSIRETLETKKIPVIALSGKRNLTQEDFTELGFTSSHPKPVKFPKLIKEIGAILFPNLKEELLNLEVETETEIKITSSNQLYNLDKIREFIGTSTDAMNNILVIFIESTQENILDLKYAAEDLDIESLGNIAHKMIPMFKQLEIAEIVPLLEHLEDHSITFHNANEAIEYVHKIENLATCVISTIKNIELS
ncbi:ATP-binding protein [Myroides guanonis]|uniref:histidine kinase n=1 Tax=Myroides guanonis TaxID=1150112 RepID=A0A1I3UVY6_9FLAO|nr:ATP-binding protein [Myroides guanonis]SFJ86869.1 hypothetical protein SAMN04487893_1209 [Myroides guanonis]